MFNKLAEINIEIFLNEEPTTFSEYKELIRTLDESLTEDLMISHINSILKEKALPQIRINFRKASRNRLIDPVGGES